MRWDILCYVIGICLLAASVTTYLWTNSYLAFSGLPGYDMTKEAGFVKQGDVASVTFAGVQWSIKTTVGTTGMGTVRVGLPIPGGVTWMSNMWPLTTTDSYPTPVYLTALENNQEIRVAAICYDGAHSGTANGGCYVALYAKQVPTECTAGTSRPVGMADVLKSRVTGNANDYTSVCASGNIFEKCVNGIWGGSSSYVWSQFDCKSGWTSTEKPPTPGLTCDGSNACPSGYSGTMTCIIGGNLAPIWHNVSCVKIADQTACNGVCDSTDNYRCPSDCPPVENQSPIVAACDDWSTCSYDGIQTRACSAAGDIAAHQEQQTCEPPKDPDCSDGETEKCPTGYSGNVVCTSGVWDNSNCTQTGGCEDLANTWENRTHTCVKKSDTSCNYDCTLKLEAYPEFNLMLAVGGIASILVGFFAFGRKKK